MSSSAGGGGGGGATGGGRQGGGNLLALGAASAASAVGKSALEAIPTGLQQDEFINYGDEVLLWSEDSLTAATGYLFTQQTFDPRVFLKATNSREDPHVRDIHACVFEVYVPFEYKNQRAHADKEKQLASLEAKELVSARSGVLYFVFVFLLLLLLLLLPSSSENYFSLLE